MPHFLRAAILFALLVPGLAAPAQAQDADWCMSLGLDLARASVRTLETALDAMSPDAVERGDYDLAWSAARTCVAYLETRAAAGLTDDDPADDAPTLTVASSLDLVRGASTDSLPQRIEAHPVPVDLPDVPAVGPPSLVEVGDLPIGPDTFSMTGCDLDRATVLDLIAQGRRTVAALQASIGTVGGMDPEVEARIRIIEDQILAGEAYLEFCFATPSASVSPPTAPVQPAAPSFAGNWSGRFSGSIGTSGCQTTESGSFNLRLEQSAPGGPASGNKSGTSGQVSWNMTFTLTRS